MKRLLCGLLCAVAVVACSAGAAQSAQIIWTGTDTATGVGWYQGWYNNGTPGAYGSEWGYGFDISTGTPVYGTDKTQPDSNDPTYPAYVDSFQYSSQGGGGGGGGNQGGGGGGTTGITYDLVMNQDKTFDFEVLFYDANYTSRNAALGTALVGTDVALEVRLINLSDNPATFENWHEITVDELEAGIYMIWRTQAPTGDTIRTEVVWGLGDGIGASAFFLDNVVDGLVTIPEPATVSLIGLGIGFLLMRRKK